MNTVKLREEKEKIVIINKSDQQHAKIIKIFKDEYTAQRLLRELAGYNSFRFEEKQDEELFYKIVR